MIIADDDSIYQDLDGDSLELVGKPQLLCKRKSDLSTSFYSAVTSRAK